MYHLHANAQLKICYTQYHSYNREIEVAPVLSPAIHDLTKVITGVSQGLGPWLSPRPCDTPVITLVKSLYLLFTTTC